ncbi:MAG: GAF domain-containing protein [Planctomycetes bacterium]|nr:GAF domain-containing protein [Planctomycetota bacterium]
MTVSSPTGLTGEHSGSHSAAAGDVDVRPAWLECLRDGQSERIALEAGRFTVGRAPQCDLVLPFKAVSREHFALERTDAGWAVVDSKSSNGTLLGGRQVKRAGLTDGDRIGFGGDPGLVPVSFIFHEGAAATRSDRFLVGEPSGDELPDVSVSFSVEDFDRILGEDFSGDQTAAPAKRAAAPVLGSVGVERPRAEPPLGRREAESMRGIGWVIALFNQMGTALLESDTLATMLHRVLELVFRNLPVERASVWLYDGASGAAECEASQARGGRRVETVEISRSIANEAVRSRQSLLIENALYDQRFAGAASIDMMSVRSAMCAPLYHGGRVTGFLYADSYSEWQAFTGQHLAMLTAMAVFAAVGIEKIKSTQQTLEMRRYLESVLKSINHLVLTLDRAGRLVTCNRPLAEHLGTDESLLRERPVDEWFDGRNRRLVESIRRVYEQPEPVYVADDELDAGGRSVSVNYTVVPLADFENRQNGVVVVLEDVTQKKRMISTLGRYLSPALAQKVLQEDEARLGGVRQEVAVLFSDIRGYTSITEKMDAQDVVEMLNQYFSAMVDAVFAEQGILDKYIGDALMAVFGVPYPSEDDSLRACRAALRMQAALTEFNRRQREAGRVELSIGTGISSGSVISGNIGSEKRLEYTCIGDGVNLASRIEGATKVYGASILISEFTQARLGGRLVLREMDLIRVVGKQEPIRIYELLAEDESQLPPQRLEAVRQFEAGLAAYRARRWKAAAATFQQALALDEDDAAAQLYLQRTLRLEAAPPAEWDGVWTLESK